MNGTSEVESVPHRITLDDRVNTVRDHVELRKCYRWGKVFAGMNDEIVDGKRIITITSNPIHTLKKNRVLEGKSWYDLYYDCRNLFSVWLERKGKSTEENGIITTVWEIDEDIS